MAEMKAENKNRNPNRKIRMPWIKLKSMNPCCYRIGSSAIIFRVFLLSVSFAQNHKVLTRPVQILDFQQEKSKSSLFAADVIVLVENAKAAKQRVGSFVLKPLPVVHLDTGASTTLEYTASDSSRN